MDKIFYFCLILIVGILCGLLFDFLIRLLINKVSETRSRNHFNTISKKHIEDCILPFNQGRSIDLVVNTIKEDNIQVDFNFDCSFSME